ncbi:MAG: hypothetical protein ACD_55C00119G0002 [uncultured bacterium]|uniref:Helix-turn-helix domain-containing protein n=1 Tax=Citrifermentans bemidjiense (strain ATCC BAA-1014 / DSM 16622 / JCM 12645 / Bem) TaxID=404380 RepID=B5EC10_CITBB|nr:helix-turn-helix domain-containing protein [Citrifermentans bemidjiense]ACH40466.1 hypothetical protein Gbem_3473 [Citrifermentans bemidjiense Bem]EKD59186.1 MAG: hypothetical protein ACD_55C00119G0002 [uncultured bacterium]
MTVLSTLLTTREAAEVLRVKESTLHQWRWQGRGPAFVKVGRLVRYRVAEVEAYIAARLFPSTTECRLEYAMPNEAVSPNDQGVETFGP